MPNFMLEDLSGSLRAIYLLPLFILIPGYTIAWLCDLFDFRRRSGPFRLALSIPLSIAICPIVTYLLGRVGSMDAVWAFYRGCRAGLRRHPVGHHPLRLQARIQGPTKELQVFGAPVIASVARNLARVADRSAVR